MSSTRDNAPGGAQSEDAPGIGATSLPAPTEMSAPPQPVAHENARVDEGEDEKSTHWLEVTATLLLGLTAVTIAWSAYQSGLWDGVQSSNETQAVLWSNESLDQYSAADISISNDEVMFTEFFVEFYKSDAATDEEYLETGVATFILVNMTEEAGEETLLWFEDDAAYLDRYEEEIPLSAEYYENQYEKANEAFALQFEFVDNAAEANSNGDDYVLASTVSALVLFLAGISLVLHARRTRIVLLVIASFFLVGSLAFLTTLPNAIGVKVENPCCEIPET